MQNIIEQLKENLFAGQYPNDFCIENKDFNFPYTHLKKNVVDAIFKNINCDFYLEIGTMHGGSAILVAEYIKEKKLNTKIVCIDPFCGDPNMWAWEKDIKTQNKWSFLNIKNGRPQIYETFLSNIKFSNNEDNIIPIFATSLVGISLIKRLHKEKRISILPNIIYLDSAHLEEETYLEIKKSYDLLNTQGVLYGDDFRWKSIKHDLVRFCNENKNNNMNLNLLKLIQKELIGSEIFLDKILTYKNQWLICK